MNDVVVFDGDCDLLVKESVDYELEEVEAGKPDVDSYVFSGDAGLIIKGVEKCELKVLDAGESGVITVIREGYPEYIGETEITPGEEIQILNTAMHTLLSNITINPIPSNYGLITWNGSVLTVS